MDEKIKTQLQSLKWRHLLDNWDELLKAAQREKYSYHRFLTEILGKEYEGQKERQRLARIKRANIPERYVMETFPFDKQPHLKKRMIMELYDSMKFMKEPQHLVFFGPTGCGKTGLGTSFLIHALNQGYRGYFIEFKDLLSELFQSLGDHSEIKVMEHFQSYDILFIDELGYGGIDKDRAGLFFELLKRRHRKRTTIITSQLGFDEWKNTLQDPHLTNAILDRVTEHCTVFNMRKCISLRGKNIVHASSHS